METEAINKLFGHISPKNVATLQKYIRLTSEMMKGEMITVCDIGTCVGKSAIAMASAVDKIRVVTIDPLDPPQLYNQLYSSDVNKKIKFYKMTSEEYYPLCPQLDTCFIDGLHEYQGVKNDILGIVSKVKKGHYVMFHDTNLYDNTIGKAVAEGEGIYYDFVELCEGEVVGNDKAAAIYVGRRI
jgi:hypothetical protein